MQNSISYCFITLYAWCGLVSQEPLPHKDIISPSSGERWWKILVSVAIFCMHHCKLKARVESENLLCIIPTCVPQQHLYDEWWPFWRYSTSSEGGMHWCLEVYLSCMHNQCIEGRKCVLGYVERYVCIQNMSFRELINILEWVYKQKLHMYYAAVLWSMQLNVKRNDEGLIITTPQENCHEIFLLV